MSTERRGAPKQPIAGGTASCRGVRAESIPRIGLRLLPTEELVDGPDPERCVEIGFAPSRPDGDTFAFPAPLRISPVDLVRLQIEAELTLGAIRAEVMKAEIAWEKALGEWYEEGRVAVESGEPDAALLARVLEGLRKKDLGPG